MERWKVFSLNGKELCSYTIYGTFDGEEEATIELLAEENNCKTSDIIVTTEEKTEAEKEFSSVMEHYDEGCKKWDKIFKDLKAGRTSGYINCYKAIEGAILENPIIYQPFTVYFDGKQLDDIRDKYGVDLFKECYADVKKKHDFE